MPFNPPFPRPLTPAGIDAYAPSEAGIYGVSNASEWILIEGTDNLHASLRSLLQEFDAPGMDRRPTGFVFEISRVANWTSRRDQLILEYKPTRNAKAARRQ
ncbi:MAG: hypothetical protein HYX27_09845 [Acidobacteria bacterium]|nr:hypothetical protein [Acidobacteriota bacterium]